MLLPYLLQGSTTFLSPRGHPTPSLSLPSLSHFGSTQIHDSLPPPHVGLNCFRNCSTQGLQFLNIFRNCNPCALQFLKMFRNCSTHGLQLLRCSNNTTVVLLFCVWEIVVFVVLHCPILRLYRTPLMVVVFVVLIFHVFQYRNM